MAVYKNLTKENRQHETDTMRMLSDNISTEPLNKDNPSTQEHWSHDSDKTKTEPKS